MTVQKKITTVALVDWNWGGHHNHHYACYTAAFLQNGCHVVPLCAAVDQVLTLVAKTPVGANVERMACLNMPASVEVPPPYRTCVPGRLRPVVQSIEHFWKIARVLRKWERSARQKVDLVFFSCIYDWEFAHFGAARWFFRYPWA